jgi:endonuclease YncB( thermonuclease family)
MRRGQWYVGAVLALCVMGSAAAAVGAPAGATYRVARVIDGDTLDLTNGQRVRLLQIDTPELGGGECYSRAARKALLRLAPEGGAVTLEADPALDRVDRYGRILRYVERDGVNVNIRLVLDGAAAPYFYRGERGKYAARLVAAVTRAKSAQRGLWGACRGTVLNVDRQVETRVGKAPRNAVTPIRPLLPGKPGAGGAGAKCDPNYAHGCVPRVDYDLDCADIRALGIAPVRVVGTDVHRLDGDGDGWGCE